MRIGEFVDFYGRALRAKKRVLALGKPGVGKTFGAMEACQHQGFDFIGICAPLEDPSTIRGYPSRGENGRASHCLFDGIAMAMEAKGPTLVYFDDLGMASESTLRSIVRLFQFGEIDGRKFPDCVVLGAASNDIGQGSGVYGMIEPLKSRFHSIVDVETNLTDVVSYGLSRDWPTDLLAYLRNSPDALHDWKPEKSMHTGGACPRSWEYVAEWIKDGFEDPEVIAGAVGKGRAAQYLAYRRLMNELPDVDQVLLDPDSAPVPKDPGACYLVSMALASRMSAGNFGQCVKYLGRMDQMFRAFSIRDAFRAEAQKRKDGKLPKDHKALSTSRDYTAWALSGDGKDIVSAAE